MNLRAVRVAVRISEDVESRWSSLEFAGRFPRGGWLRLRYHTNLQQDLVRPLLRISTSAGDLDFPMPAGLFGVGEWVGYVPGDASRILVQSNGLHDLTCEAVPLPAVFAQALQKDLGAALFAAGLALGGHMVEARDAIGIACRSTQLGKYHWWRARYSRKFDPLGGDSTANVGADAPRIVVVIARHSETPASAFETTCAALKEQTYDGWTLHVDSRDVAVCLPELAASVDPQDFVTELRPGDVLPPYAFAAVVRYAVDHPQVQLIYGDEDAIDRRGRFVRPSLKPDFSPIYHAFARYLGRAVYVRAAVVRATSRQAFSEVPDSGIESGLLTAPTVGHIRRILLTCPEPARDALSEKRLNPRRRARGERMTATIVIPTRDRPDLLGPCLSSLQRLDGLPHDIIIIDNGSTQPATHSLYRSMGRAPGVRIIDAPGTFNFSALCNRGAREARGQMLVFLNDDTEALCPDWLVRLEEWAMRPDCGAVGAKLLYPKGRVQHAGLVLGLGGYAAHVESGARFDDPGYLYGLQATREVSAVTGACLAVEKSKFHAVGGFDEQCFPVELGDVDLCLRLESRGWKCVFAADVLLMHRESASRGRVRHREQRYAMEHRHFRERWGSRLWDDPFFHAALSLDSLHVKLDG
jgi:GT2 family glycosyltransferase